MCPLQVQGTKASMSYADPALVPTSLEQQVSESQVQRSEASASHAFPTLVPQGTKASMSYADPALVRTSLEEVQGTKASSSYADPALVPLVWSSRFPSHACRRLRHQQATTIQPRCPLLWSYTCPSRKCRGLRHSLVVGSIVAVGFAVAVITCGTEHSGHLPAGQVLESSAAEQGINELCRFSSDVRWSEQQMLRYKQTNS